MSVAVVKKKGQRSSFTRKGGGFFVRESHNNHHNHCNTSASLPDYLDDRPVQKEQKKGKTDVQQSEKQTFE